MTSHLKVHLKPNERVYINGGRRGYLVGLSPADVVRVLKPVLVDIATSPPAG